MKPPASGTYLEIDRTCFEANIRALHKELGPSELCMVVKGNAYGHGYDAMVPLAEAAGVRCFAVFSSREAAGFLRASDGQSRLMVMGHSEPDNVAWLINNGVELWINDIHGWQHIAATKVPAKVHLELETGMHRTGVSIDNAMTIVAEIEAHPHVQLVGLCTHLAGRESSENDDRIAEQKARFHAFAKAIAKRGLQPQLHMASSASALLDPDGRLDLCRVGIACYGLWPSNEVFRQRNRRPDAPVLRNVMTWKSKVLAIQDVPDGEFVGYGKSHEAEGDTRIAILGVGYADGFARALSNNGHVLLHGRRASIVGNVNMSMIQVNVTHIPETEVGDEAVLIGRQGEREISVASFSDFNNLVNYELMSRLSHELPRIVTAPRGLAEPLI